MLSMYCILDVKKYFKVPARYCPLQCDSEFSQTLIKPALEKDPRSLCLKAVMKSSVCVYD